jgi:nicotinic acid mononucleotide adenylyltransferase
MKDAIVILGGAFNPVHSQHIALLCLAKQELEITGEWNIIGGYLAVAPDNYVLHKLKSRNERTIKLKHRLALINEAMKDIPWLINSPFQEEMLKQHDGSAIGLGQRIKGLLKNDNIQILILIGGDRMVKKGVPIWRKPSGKTSVIRVGVGRIMNENINLFELWQDDLHKNLIHNPKEFILLNIPLQSVSSSIIRIHLNQWFNAKDDPEKQIQIENDLINSNSFLHSPVMNYIKNHQDHLYIDI